MGRFNIGKSFTEERNQKISKALKGRKLTEGWRRKLSEAAKGRKRLPHTEETKQKMRLAQLGEKNHRYGKKLSEEHKRKIRKFMLGNKYSLDYKPSEETKKKVSKFMKGRYCGKDNPNWKGGISPINVKLRNSDKGRDWRLEIFKRDNYTCQICNKRGTYLIAHHIKSFADYPELRFDINNGITLCEECHKEIHKKLQLVS